MTSSITLLKKRYLSNIKENPNLFIGIELEFPVVEKSGQATDVTVTKNLLKQLPELLDFSVEKLDDEGNPIQLVSNQNEDRILFEVSYTTIEFAFARAETISEVENRFNQYLTVIQDVLSESNHEIQGHGVNPNWAKNDNSPVKSPRYQMLMSYLSLAHTLEIDTLHSYPEYGAFICGNQVQLDVSKSNYVRVINTFNQIEAAKAYIFANSEFWGQNWDTKISRDIFWEHSMHGILKENVGINPFDFINEDDFFNYLNKTAVFTAERDGKTYYFEPIPAHDYLLTKDIKAYAIDGTNTLLTPLEKDFDTHRSYQYQDLTTRGTIEFRSVCTQALDRTFSVSAFHLGLIVNLKQLEEYLSTSDFFEKYGRNYPILRKYFSKKILSSEEIVDIKKFSREILNISQKGLIYRNNGEEHYLLPLLEQVK